MSNIVPFSDMQQMAEVAATSKMFGFKNTQEALAIMLLCQGENMHPAVAMRDYHVIQGRPALKADAMLARFQQAGGSVNWKEYTDEQVTAVFSHPAGGTLEVTWTISQAESIGIAGKDNWKKYPRAMLRARCVSEGIRSVYPASVVGVYTPEEVVEFTPSAPKDMGMAERVQVVPAVENVEQSQEDEGAFPLHFPNEDKPHARYFTVEDWIAGYGKVINRISLSQKFDAQQKIEKYKALSDVNEGVVESFDSFQKVKLKAEISKSGGSNNPKLPVFVSLPPGSEHNVEIF